VTKRKILALAVETTATAQFSLTHSLTHHTLPDHIQENVKNKNISQEGQADMMKKKFLLQLSVWNTDTWNNRWSSNEGMEL
jgi:hypothetical protein